jgi:hypothetical protein
MSSHAPAKKITAEGEDRIEAAMEGAPPTNLHDLGSQVAEELIKTRILLKKHSDAVVKGSDEDNEDTEVRTYLKDRMTCLLAAFNCIQRSPKLALEIGAEGMESMLGYLTKKAQESAADAEVKDYVSIIQKKLPGAALHASLKTGGLIRSV